MGFAWANLAPMNPVAGTDANGESWNIIPNRVFLKAGGNTANSADADRFVTSVAHLQSFMARPGRLSYAVIDLREASLYNASHIHSALNYPTADPDNRSPTSPPRPPSLNEAKQLIAPTVGKADLPEVFKKVLGRDYVIFHCLQSAHRGPTIATAWANYLKANGNTKTKVVLLNGGWNAVDRWCKTPGHFGQMIPLDGTDHTPFPVPMPMRRPSFSTSFTFSAEHPSNLVKRPTIKTSSIRRSSWVARTNKSGGGVSINEVSPRSPLTDSTPRMFAALPSPVEEPSTSPLEQPPMKRLKLMFTKRLVSTTYA